MTRKELPAPETDVYDDFPGFLKLVVEWLTRRKKNGTRRDGAAWKIIRTASLRDDNNGLDKKVFCGVGVYNASELLHRAGKYLSTSNGLPEIFNQKILQLFLSMRLKLLFSMIPKAPRPSAWPIIKSHGRLVISFGECNIIIPVHW